MPDDVLRDSEGANLGSLGTPRVNGEGAGSAEYPPTGDRRERRVAGGRGSGRRRSPDPASPLPEKGAMSPEELLRFFAVDTAPGTKHAPEDPDAHDRWPGMLFLLSMLKGLDDKFCEAAGFSVNAKGGTWAWSLRAPGYNRRYSGTAPSLLDLFDQIEAQITGKTALIDRLKTSKEDQFQKNRKIE